MWGQRCYLDVKTVKLREESSEYVKLGDLIEFLIVNRRSSLWACISCFKFIIFPSREFNKNGSVASYFLFEWATTKSPFCLSVQFHKICRDSMRLRESNCWVCLGQNNLMQGEERNSVLYNSLGFIFLYLSVLSWQICLPFARFSPWLILLFCCNTLQRAIWNSVQKQALIPHKFVQCNWLEKLSTAFNHLKCYAKGTFLITRFCLLLLSRELSNCDSNTDL